MVGPDTAPAFGGDLGGGDLKELVTAAFDLGANKASLAATQGFIEPLEANLAPLSLHPISR